MGEYEILISSGDNDGDISIRATAIVIVVVVVLVVSPRMPIKKMVTAEYHCALNTDRRWRESEEFAVSVIRGGGVFRFLV